MGWKMEGEQIVLENGNPVYVYPDGKESPLDGDHITQKIADLTNEAATRKRSLREAEDKLKAFEGIEDVEAAKKALDTVKNLDAKKLIEAGEVEKLKSEYKAAYEGSLAEVEKSYKAKISEKDAMLAEKDATLTAEVIGGRFSRSKYIAEKLIVPPDIAQAYFGNAFRIEEGKVVAYDHTGNRIYSRERPGEGADFEEAIAALVASYPNKDSILKAPERTGGGASYLPGGQTNQQAPGVRQSNASTPQERVAAIAAKYPELGR